MEKRNLKKEKFNYDKEIPSSGKSLLWREKNLLMNDSEFTNSRERNSVRASEQERVKLGLRGLRALLSRRLKGESKSERKGISREGKTLSSSPSPRRGWQGLTAFTRLVKHFRSFRSQIRSQTKFRNFVAHLYGFTLAEVLITLTLLGVIAAIAIPGIVRNFQDRAQISSFKRAYSILDNAFSQMFVIEGDPFTWSWPNNKSDKIEYLGQMLSKYLPTQKYCGASDGCMPTYADTKSCYGSYTNQPTYKRLNGENGGHSFWTEFNTEGKMILKNNMMIAIKSIDLSNDRVAVVRIDINGKKEPNRYGYDVFFFDVSKYGLINYQAPRTNGDCIHCTMFYSKYCNRTSTSDYNGHACSTWILKHNNMDYKYRDVSSEW